MSWLKYKLIILIFIAAVAAGVSVALSEFNHMIYPVGPVSVFSLKGGEYGVYQMEFLGEECRVEFPADLAMGLFTGETVEAGTKHLTGAVMNLKNNSVQVLNKGLLNISITGGKIASDMVSRANEIIGTLPLKAWLPVGGAEERK